MIYMKDFPIKDRPNIGVDKMQDFDFGGLCVESTHPNGALVYVPYGIWFDIFDTLERSMYLMVHMHSKLKTEYADIKDKEGIPTEVLEGYKNKLNTYTKDIQLLESIIPLCQEI